MNTFTAQELADFYQKVADGGEIEYLYEGAHKFMIKAGPDLSGYLDHWRIKPAKKVIDLSVLIESGIDCEFRQGGDWFIDKLKGIDYSDLYPYISTLKWKYCRPRMNHKHTWKDVECPLPEGFEVRVWFRGGGHTVITTGSGNYWRISVATMCFEVLGVADGYVMPKARCCDGVWC
tara:strand:- start:490 stop:1017 length:528 start_codon:yes stop_codon:yes gene_type:complete